MARHEISMYTGMLGTHIAIDIIRACSYATFRPGRQRSNTVSKGSLSGFTLWVNHIGSSFCGDSSCIPESAITTTPNRTPHQSDGPVRVFLIRFVIIVIVDTSTTGASALPYQTSSRTHPIERMRMFIFLHLKLHKLFVPAGSAS